MQKIQSHLGIGGRSDWINKRGIVPPIPTLHLNKEKESDNQAPLMPALQHRGLAYCSAGFQPATKAVSSGEPKFILVNMPTA